MSRRSLAAASYFSHGGQIPTTKGVGLRPLLTQYNHRWPQSHETLIENHIGQGYFWPHRWLTSPCCCMRTTNSMTQRKQCLVQSIFFVSPLEPPGPTLFTAASSINLHVELIRVHDVLAQPTQGFLLAVSKEPALHRLETYCGESSNLPPPISPIAEFTRSSVGVARWRGVYNEPHTTFPMIFHQAARNIVDVLIYRCWRQYTEENPRFNKPPWCNG